MLFPLYVPFSVVSMDSEVVDLDSDGDFVDVLDDVEPLLFKVEELVTDDDDDDVEDDDVVEDDKVEGP